MSHCTSGEVDTATQVMQKLRDLSGVRVSSRTIRMSQAAIASVRGTSGNEHAWEERGCQKNTNIKFEKDRGEITHKILYENTYC